MFDHPLIQVHAFEDIPLNQDLSLMDEKWMVEFEAALLKSVAGGGETADPGRLLFLCCRQSHRP